MRRTGLAVAAALAAACALTAARADLIPSPDGITVKASDIAAPTRGMTMAQVSSKFGEPTNKVAAVGKPPIARWEYPGFVVYFEGDHVIHSVVSAGSAPAAPAAAPAAAASGSVSG